MITMVGGAHKKNRSKTIYYCYTRFCWLIDLRYVYTQA
jgi:hypothetical protein